MSTNGIGSSPDINRLASRMFDKADTNHDGQVSKDEFGTLLNAVLQGASVTAPTSPSQGTITDSPLAATVRALASSPSVQTLLPGILGGLSRSASK